MNPAAIKTKSTLYKNGKIKVNSSGQVYEPEHSGSNLLTHFCAQKMALNSFQYLLEQGHNPYKKDCYSKTAFNYTASPEDKNKLLEAIKNIIYSRKISDKRPPSQASATTERRRQSLSW
jgi:hypothetical protein